MVSKVVSIEDLHMFVTAAFRPAVLVMFFDPGSMRFHNAFAFVAEGFGFFLELLPSVDQHDSALMRFRRVVSQHPDVGENAGVVKQLIGQHDNRIQPVVFQNPPPNFAFAGTTVSVRQRRAVEDNGNPAAGL